MKLPAVAAGKQARLVITAILSIEVHEGIIFVITANSGA